MSGEEGTIVVAKPREGGGALSISCPMLTTTNYTFWAVRMRSILKVHKVWETIDTELQDEEKNDLAIALLFEALPENLVLQFGELDTAKKVWDAVKSEHVGAERVRDARLQTLMSSFDKLKMKDSESIDEFVKRMTEISSKSASLGTKIEGSKMVKKFLKCLPRKKYIQIVASLEQALDLNNTSFEDIVGRLKAYEERIADEEDSEEQQEDQTKLMYANADGSNPSSSSNQHENSGNYNGTFRGRGRGGRFQNRGRGRGRFGGRGFDFSQVTCFRCDKMGHFASHCPDRILKLQEAQETEKGTEDADELMLNEVVFLNEKHCVPSKFETNTDKDDIWYLDNGASNHMTGDKRYFDSLDSTVSGKVRFGDDSRINIRGKGTIAFVDLNGKARRMTDVYYIPGLKSNIVSLGQATEAGCDIRLKDGHLTMLDRDGKLLVKAERSPNRLYKVKMGLKESVLCNLSNARESNRWHARLGHVNFATLNSMIERRIVYGAPEKALEKKLCSSCLLGKQTRHVFPQATAYRATKKLELIHGDLCGPITPSTKAGNRYIFVLIDDYSRYMWTVLLREKREAFEKFRNFKALVEKEADEKIQTLRTDRGGEFVSNEFSKFCEKYGIKRHLTAPYTPQQNGIVERRNRTLMEMARSILKHMHMPNYLWGEAVRHSTYVLNRVSTRALKDKTPYEMFRGKKPNVGHIRVFGCIGYAKIEAPHLKKLDDRTRVLVHLGTEPGSKAYRLVDPTTGKITVSRDVIFDESKGWSWKDEDSIRESSGSFRIKIDVFGNHGLEEEMEMEQPAENSKSRELLEDAENREEDNEISEQETSQTNESTVVLRQSTREKHMPKYLEDYVLIAEEEG